MDERITIYPNWSEADRRDKYSSPTRFPATIRVSLSDLTVERQAASAHVHSVVVVQLVEIAGAGYG